MQVLSTKVPDHVRKQVEAQASRAGMSPSGYVRFILQRVTGSVPDVPEGLAEEAEAQGDENEVTVPA